MKKILYLMASALVMLSCEKDKIEPKILDNLVNYYEIKNDNPDDPVQCERYELYKEYGVPVYFSDTIAKVFVKISPKGDSVFRYERVDMNWKFSSNTVSTFRYTYENYDNDADKLKALAIARSYLEKASKPLRPFCFLATKTATRTKVDGVADYTSVPFVTYEIGYRALLLQGLSTYSTPEKINIFTTDLRKMMITAKLKNFERELEEFDNVSDEKWYDKYFKESVTNGGLGVVWDSSHVLRRYKSNGKFDREEKIELSAMRITYKYYARDYLDDKEETFESFRQMARAKIGAFGFVSTHKNNSMSSYPVSQELGLFLDEILTTNREEFTRRWGTSPLVMKKYNILYKIIKEQMDVDLDAE